MPSTHKPAGSPSAPLAVNGRSVTDLTIYDDVLLDYCAGCVNERGCNRMATLTTPLAITRYEGARVKAYYRCPHGHAWTCNWTVPESA